MTHRDPSPGETGQTRAKEPNIEKAAASIAALVDEFTQRGWNDEGRADFAKVIKRRLTLLAHHHRRRPQRR